MICWCEVDDKSAKITPERSSCGVLNKEKKDFVNLNKALTTSVHSISEEPKLMKRQTSNQKRQRRTIKVARKMEILSKKANQVSIVYLSYENRRWEVI